MQIYKTTNLINDKIYVGQDQNNNSWYYGSGNLIKLAIKKYGKEKFTKEIIEHCTDIDDLNDAEIFWIWKLNSLVPNGYNITKGGGGKLGVSHPHTEEHKRKISESKKGKTMGKDNHFYGKHHTEASNLKNRNAHLGKKHSEESKLLISRNGKGKQSGDKHHMYGKHHSKKTLKLMSLSHTGKKNHNYGKPMSKEQKQKISKTKTKYIIPKETLNQLYILDNKTYKEIANMYNCSSRTIQRKLKKYNIKKYN